jgi:phosphoribosylformylglycinamidine synthase subunit PurL
MDDLIAALPRPGMLALVLGETHGHLGQSALLAEMWGREDGDAPPVDLDIERRHGEFILANRSLIHACADLSDGGLALAAFEMADAAGLGVTLDAGDIPTLFGEDQGRYLIACSLESADDLMVAAGRAGAPLTVVGRFGGDTVRLGPSHAPLSGLSDLYRSAFTTALFGSPLAGD